MSRLPAPAHNLLRPAQHRCAGCRGWGPGSRCLALSCLTPARGAVPCSCQRFPLIFILKSVTIAGVRIHPADYYGLPRHVDPHRTPGLSFLTVRHVTILSVQQGSDKNFNFVRKSKVTRSDPRKLHTICKCQELTNATRAELRILRSVSTIRGGNVAADDLRRCQEGVGQFGEFHRAARGCLCAQNEFPPFPGIPDAAITVGYTEGRRTRPEQMTKQKRSRQRHVEVKSAFVLIGRWKPLHLQAVPCHGNVCAARGYRCRSTPLGSASTHICYHHLQLSVVTQ